MNRSRDRVTQLVKQLYGIVGELETLFSGRRFTLDGHLVGSLGEVIAAHDYDLELLDSSTATHDAKTKRGDTQVQIKATQRRSVSLYAEPDHLLVLKLEKDGSTREVYNGPGDLPWKCAGKPQKNGQKPISLSKLERLMKMIPSHQRLKRR